jgi:hypothetical protein
MIDPTCWTNPIQLTRKSKTTTNRSRAVTTKSKSPGSGEPHLGLQSTPIFSSHRNSQHATHITTRPILSTKVSSYEAAQHPEHPCQTTHLSLQRQHERAALARHEPETRVESWENHVSVSHTHRRTTNTGQEHIKQVSTYLEAARSRERRLFSSTSRK